MMASNIFHTEYGNLRTDYQLIVPSFEYTATNEARLNITLGANVPATNSVKITFHQQSLRNKNGNYYRQV